jgi:hypothetical protein
MKNSRVWDGVTCGSGIPLWQHSWTWHHRCCSRRTDLQCAGSERNAFVLASNLYLIFFVTWGSGIPLWQHSWTWHHRCCSRRRGPQCADSERTGNAFVLASNPYLIFLLPVVPESPGGNTLELGITDVAVGGQILSVPALSLMPLF